MLGLQTHLDYDKLISLIYMKYFFIFLVIIVAILEVVGDILFKEWTIHDKKFLLVIGVIFYMAATIFWAFSLKYHNLSKAVVIFAVITLIVGVLVGVLIYKENLNALNIIGILLGLTSIILLEI
jgi:multidrug transporter EmrE-like cation transporter